jgi:hypothetical protein
MSEFNVQAVSIAIYFLLVSLGHNADRFARQEPLADR